MKAKNRVTVSWDVSAADLKQLRMCARGWGHKTVASYIRMIVEAKIGSPVGCAARAKEGPS